jgi:hypothetical protein
MGWFKNVKKAISKAGKDLARETGTAATNVWREGAKVTEKELNQTILRGTAGAWSPDGKTGWAQGNSVGGALGSAIVVQDTKDIMKIGSDAFSGKRKDEKDIGNAGIPDAPTEAEKDPYLEEELKNARKRGRASTVLAGSNDAGNNGSARRTLLGSL